MGRFLQRTDSIEQLAHSRMPVVGMALLKVVIDTLKVGCRGGRPADTHLGAEHLLQAGVHFFFLDELAPVGLRNALADSGTKAVVFLKQAQRGIFHQPLGVGACFGGNVRKLCFLLGSEMNFHRFQSRRNLGPGQPVGSGLGILSRTSPIFSQLLARMFLSIRKFDFTRAVPTISILSVPTIPTI